MRYDLLVGRAAVSERSGLVGGRQVAPQAAQCRRDVETLERLGDYSDGLKLWQHHAVEVVQEVTAEETVRGFAEVVVQPDELSEQGIRRVGDVLDVEAELGKDVAACTGCRGVVVGHGRVVEEAVDGSEDLLGFGNDLVLVAEDGQTDCR